MFKYECDSRKVKEGQTFIAIKGFNHDGHDYINEAINNGASHIISEKDLDISIPYTKVRSTKVYLRKILHEEYGNIISKLKIIGITGTNGKTTSTYLTYQMLILCGYNACYIGTLGYINKDEHISLCNTTPDILTLYKMLYHSYNKGIKYVVMEVSSQGLSMHRVHKILFDVIGYTNLSLDHLDYHHDMTSYLNAKLKILKHLKKNSIIVINSDDEKAYKFKVSGHHYYSFGYTGAFKILNYELYENSSTLLFSYDNLKYKVNIPLTCTFNIYNYLMCLVICYSLDININDIINKTKYLESPSGRCELYYYNGGYVIIDYAHTPDAIEKILLSYNKIKKGKIITIFGCGGSRDKSKRSIMGNIVTMLSDYAIITNDNPRNEEPIDIVKDIIKGIEKNNYEVILDRSNSIKKGMSMIKENDILLILGKGHEDYQIIGNNKIHYSDKEEVLKNCF